MSWESLFGGGAAAAPGVYGPTQDPSMLNNQQQLLMQPGAAYGPQLDPRDQQAAPGWLERTYNKATEVRSDGTTAAGQAMKGMGGGMQMMQQAQPVVRPPAMAPVQANPGGAYTPAARQQALPGNPYLPKMRGLLDG